jgi:type 1 glutamine amidotransferase
MMGRIESRDSPEPVAWVNSSSKSRVFYTSLGHADDFKLPAFTRLLENGIRWAAAGGRAPLPRRG